MNAKAYCRHIASWMGWHIMANPCLSIDIGTLKKRITIEALQRVSDDQGGWLEQWVKKYTVWASIEPLSQKEVYQGMQAASPLSHKIIIRYIPLLITKERIDYNGRKFNITSIRNLNEAGIYQEILAFEAL